MDIIYLYLSASAEQKIAELQIQQTFLSSSFVFKLTKINDKAT